MEQLEQILLNKLLDLETAVAMIATANPKPDLMGLFGEIEALTGQLPKNTDPTLLHYLHRKSYQKARLFLQGRDAENKAGNCIR
ncbi:MAG: hypothetical protein M2R45_04309 [Verrucomicrobia subdivision 3 bacterium]|nr:hypothetical protein [Limisphaerales bacterium]MCS1417224.1 hypothetical protein [Limisphaerales bacterium]